MYQITGEHPWWNAMSIKFQIALRHGCSSVNLQHIFRTTFPKNTSGGLLLSIVFNIFQYFYSKCCRLLDSIETNGSVLTKGINVLASSCVLSFVELCCVLSFVELCCVLSFIELSFIELCSSCVLSFIQLCFVFWVLYFGRNFSLLQFFTHLFPDFHK